MLQEQLLREKIHAGQTNASFDSVGYSVSRQNSISWSPQSFGNGTDLSLIGAAVVGAAVVGAAVIDAAVVGAAVD